MVFTSLGVALLFAAIYLFGGRLAYRPGQRGRRRFLSFAAGISVAYIFVHVLPTLQAIRELRDEVPGQLQDAISGVQRLPVDHGRLPGFLRHRNHGGQSATRPGKPRGRRPRFGPLAALGSHRRFCPLYLDPDVHDGVDGERHTCLVSVRGGHGHAHLHDHLRSKQPLSRMYDRRGAYLLALASLAGWVSAQTLDIPRPILLDLVAFVSGGVVVNAAIAELPKEREGRYWSFVTGATVYTALLLLLSHFEKGGDR